MTEIAIVIPTLNRAAMLRGAIGSALRCRPAPQELVVVDCGSTDDTRDVVRSFGDDVELIERSLPNAAAARNTGLAATRSRYVGFLDSDDEALPDKTGGLAAALDDAPGTGLVHGTLEVVGSAGEPLAEEAARTAGEMRRARAAGTDYPALASLCSMYTSATLMRREALEEVGGYDEALDTYEDWDLYLRLSRRWRLEYVDRPAARYRVWPGNVAWDRTAGGVVEVARKHLAMLSSMPVGTQRATEFGLLRRIASSEYTLVNLPEARGAAWSALRLDPSRALADPDVRRVLTRGWMPPGLLERRRSVRSR